MKHSTKLLITSLISALTMACGGGGGGGGSSTPPTPAVAEVSDNTADIVAERDFSFDIGEKLLSLLTILARLRELCTCTQKRRIPQRMAQ